MSLSVLDFGFCIGTGDPLPVCCCQQNYWFHKCKIVNQQITSLEASDLITNCGGVWGSLLFLAVKPHQDNCTDIGTFV